MDTDDLTRIANEHPLRVARAMATGIKALAVTAATEAKGTQYEAAVRGPVNRILEAGIELRALGVPTA